MDEVFAWLCLAPVLGIGALTLFIFDARSRWLKQRVASTEEALHEHWRRLIVVEELLLSHGVAPAWVRSPGVHAGAASPSPQAPPEWSSPSPAPILEAPAHAPRADAAAPWPPAGLEFPVSPMPNGKAPAVAAAAEESIDVALPQGATEPQAETEPPTEWQTETAGSTPSEAAPVSEPWTAGDDHGSLERWLGVRGAAALGATVLVVAAVFFLRFSVEQGWVTPMLRLALALVAGLGLVVVSESPLRHRYAALTSWLAGAGVAVLFTALWAATSVFGLLSWPAGALGMVAVTGLAGALSLRRDALPIAFLGLFGGFATPLLLSTPEPATLVSYLVVLNAGTLSLAARRGWSSLALASAVATAAYLGQWLFLEMGAEEQWLGLVVTALFAGGFALTPLETRGTSGISAGVTRALAVVLPVAFSLPLGAVGGGPPVLITATLLFVLTAGAGWLADYHRASWLDIAGVVSACGVLLSRAIGPIDVPEALILAVAALAISGRAALHDRWREHQGRSTGRVFWSAAPASAFLVLALGVAHPELPAWLSVAPLAALALLCQAQRPPHGTLVPIAVGLAGGVMTFARPGAGDQLVPWVATLLGLGCFLWATRPNERDHGIAAGALLALLFPVAGGALLTPLGATVGFGLLALLWTRAFCLRSVAWWAVAATAGHLVALRVGLWSAEGVLPSLALSCGLVTVGLSLAAPFTRALRSRPESWLVSAAVTLGGLFALLPFAPRALPDGGLVSSYTAVASTLAIGSAIALATTWLLRGEAPAPAARPVLALTTAALVIVAGFLGLPAVAWPAVWACSAVGLLLVGRDVERPTGEGLQILAGVGFIAAALGIGAGFLMTWFDPPALLPQVLSCVITAVALSSAARTVRPSMATPWLEGGAALSAFVGTHALAVSLSEHLDGVAAPLTLSFAWGLFALALLGVGMRRSSALLRWMSLAAMLVTSAKVFLLDLGNLEDLERVASLVGLAATLLLVSVAYHRFVFRSDRRSAPGVHETATNR